MVERGTHKPKVGGSIPPAAMMLLGVFLAGASFAGEKATDKIRIPTGIEWLSSSMGQRFNSVITSMAVLSQSGVPVSRTPADYYTALEKKLKREPALNDTALTDLLAEHVYATEPEARVPLDKLRRPDKVI